MTESKQILVSGFFRKRELKRYLVKAVRTHHTLSEYTTTKITYLACIGQIFRKNQGEFQRKMRLSYNFLLKKLIYGHLETENVP